MAAPPQSPQATAPGLARHRGYWRWSASAQLTRLPIAMAPLAFTSLSVALAGTYELGAAIVATIVVAEVVCAVPVGRLLDRFGPVLTLRVLLVLRGLAYLAVLFALWQGAPSAACLVLAALVGCLGGGLLGGLRALLTDIVGPALLTRAVAVNTMMVDVVIVGGPLLVGLLATFSVLGPVVAMAIASVLAAPLVYAAGTRRAKPAVRPARSGALLMPLLGWIVCAFAVGHVASGIEVAVLPIAQRLGGGTAAATLIVGVLCVASTLGGFVFLRLDRRGTPRTVAALLLLYGSGAALVVCLGHSWPVVIAGTALAGVCLGPLINMNSLLAEAILPDHRRSEGFALINTAQGLGFGLGSLALSVLPLTLTGLLALASAALAALAVLRPPGRRAAVEPGPGPG
ncbi:MFS transporter [Streptomyces cyaneofuscatus]|uniref:MFS transporter n=1 Tax=Streptomyces cyaneofuscatus TaxID=66883 RepID=A0ABZ1F4D9_9ACTN|nr:MFS transporter [Streptomyces cyaneofuscatus]WSB11206.1 MFS transporter [Streptomyces cyaneofuscatus]WSD45261.1 MFS transporter [Streptomyces cyaneofuscatus]